MNKVKLFCAILSLASIVSLTSCDNEPIDSALNLEDFSNDDGSGNGNGNASGDYMPLALNNIWYYAFYNSTTVKDYKINAVESIDGVTYYRLNRAITSPIETTLFTESDVTVHMRKSNGNYYQRTHVHKEGTSSSPAITIEPFELIFLKDYLAVGESFSQTVNITTSTTFLGVTNTSTEPTTYVITIMGKNLSVTVGETTFNEVIKVKMEYEDGSFSYDWFAKNVGWIKSEDYDSDVSPQNGGLSITDYTLY